MLGKIESRKEKEMTTVEMVEWLYCFKGHEFEQTAGDSEGQGSLMCWTPGGCRSQIQLSD